MVKGTRREDALASKVVCGSGKIFSWSEREGAVKSLRMAQDPDDEPAERYEP